MTLANRIAELAGPLPRFVGITLAIALAGPVAAQADPDTLSLVPGTAFHDCPVCPEMVVIPAGSFIMGSPATEEGRDDDEGPQHEVTIDYAFAVGVYEVTFDEWDACVRGGGCGEYEPSDRGWGRGTQPVIWVNWEDAWLYADWLTEQAGAEYRLLTEAEWEYVARAGTRTARYWGETDREQCRYANGYDANGHAEHGFDRPMVGCRDRQPNSAPAGSYPPNGFGVFDILGNVREWVDDCVNWSYDGAPTDGSSWLRGDCTRRITRGGSWLADATELRSASRRASLADFRNFALGFRVARHSVFQPGHDQADSTQAIYDNPLSAQGLGMRDYFNIGAWLYNAEVYDQAAEAFRHIVDVAPENRDAVFNLAQSLYEGEDWETLIPIALQLVELDGYTYDSYLILSRALLMSGNGEAAQVVYNVGEGLSFQLANTQFQPRTDGASIVGELVNMTLDPGTTVTIRVHFNGLDGAEIGTTDIRVDAPAQGAAQPFRADFSSNEEVLGYYYEVMSPG